MVDDLHVHGAQHGGQVRAVDLRHPPAADRAQIPVHEGGRGGVPDIGGLDVDVQPRRSAQLPQTRRNLIVCGLLECTHVELCI